MQNITDMVNYEKMSNWYFKVYCLKNSLKF